MNHGTTRYTLVSSPLGPLTVATDGMSISKVRIEDSTDVNQPQSWIQAPDHPLLQAAAQQLEEYFTGKRDTFDLPLKLAGTSFQEQVWQALRNIPAGKTVSYGDIARRIGHPRAVRAVGTAVGRNPLCIIIPCHRVVRGDGSLGGYAAGPTRKQQLLALEHAR